MPRFLPHTPSPLPHVACRIVKPVGLSRGRGIRLIRSTRELGNPTPDDPLIVQRYVTSPLLVQVGLSRPNLETWPEV